MVATAPHYLLLTETQDSSEESDMGGFWRFVLQQVDGCDYLEVADTEPDMYGERLQLLAAIRGVEAIGQPSRLTLVTTSGYVIRGIRRDLAAWRESNWTWERFGELHDIKHRNLWQRLDRALRFHSVQCRS
jgi:ribonuclease HI